jgi:hypothetical protein
LQVGASEPAFARVLRPYGKGVCAGAGVNGGSRAVVWVLAVCRDRCLRCGRHDKGEANGPVGMTRGMDEQRRVSRRDGPAALSRLWARRCRRPYGEREISVHR